MAIKIKDLTKVYGTKEVLKITDLTFKDERITAIVGPNGAGKSTLLGIIAKTLTKTGGDVDLGGISQREMTLLFQEVYLLEGRVFDNIAYPLKLRAIAKDERRARVEKIASELSIDYLEKSVHALSKGEKAKVAIARALVFEPRLLLLDEPCANLDPAVTFEIERILKGLHHKTVIMITHDLDEAKRIADDVVLLNKGQVVKALDKESFFESDDPVVQKFIRGELLV